MNLNIGLKLIIIIKCKKKTIHTLFYKPSIKNRIALKIPELVINNKLIEQKRFMKLLGVILGECISWKDHIRAVENKIAKNIGLLYRAKQILILSSLKDTLKTLDDFKNKQKGV